jgi:hypothetical protein
VRTANETAPRLLAAKRAAARTSGCQRADAGAAAGSAAAAAAAIAATASALSE